jgi:hypothetical protein
MYGEGRQPTLYYLCLGQMPASIIDEQVKFNLPIYILNMFSIACHTFVCGRFLVSRLAEIYRKKTKVIPASTAVILNKINQESLFRSATVLSWL